MQWHHRMFLLFWCYKKWCYPLPDGIQSLHFAEGNALLADSILVLTALNKTENVGMLLAINVNTGEKIWDYKSNARDFLILPVQMELFM